MCVVLAPCHPSWCCGSLGVLGPRGRSQMLGQWMGAPCDPKWCRGRDGCPLQFPFTVIRLFLELLSGSRWEESA